MRRFLFSTALVIGLSAAPAALAAHPGANGRIAFTRDAAANEEIWTARPDGSDPRQITSNGWGDRMPAFSPDGMKIAFVSLENGTANPEIYVMNADGSGRTRLTTSTGNVAEADPAWSPDGSKIAFMSRRELGNADIWVMAADGTDAVRLTTDAADDQDPAWSPDGSTIAFETARDGGAAEIWAMTAAGDAEHALTATSGLGNQDPSWSPDGKRIAFLRSGQIHVMDADGTDVVNLTSALAGVKATPAFSPDGTRIAFGTNGDGQPEIHTMASDGSDDRRVTTTGPAGSRAPDWQPISQAGPEPTPTPTASATVTPGPDPGAGTPPGGGSGPSPFEGGGPPSATCAKASVRFGDVEVLASCFSPKGRVNVATGRVRVNGLDLVPASGEIAIDPEARTITSTRSVRVTAGAVPLFTGRLDWDFSRGRLELPLGGDAAIRLIRLTGTATITTDGLGRFRIAVLPRIDSVFDRFAVRLGAVSGDNLRLPAITGDAVLRTANATGLSLAALRLTAASVPIGMLELRSLVLDFEPEAGNWSGTAKLELPGPHPQVIADASVVVRDGAFERASLVAGNSLGAYGFGVRLERLALDARTDPFRFGGELALGAGPSLPGLGQLIRMNGSVAFTAGTPSELRLRGRTQVGPASGNASYTALSTGRQDFTGDLALAPREDVGLFANVSGTVLPQAFVFLGSARARLFGLELPGEGLVSSTGAAACVPVKATGGGKSSTSGAFRVGFGYRYATRQLDLMSGTCGVAPWSPIPLGDKAAGSAARAAQQAVVSAFDVRDGLPGVVIELTGDQAPPAVTLTGPAGPVEPLVLRDAALRRTYLAIAAPRAGRWRVTPAPGSSPVTAVRRGDGLPAPRVSARVGGRGHARRLRWSLRALPGQVVRFSEEGRGAAKMIAATRKARGSKRFRPADGPAGRRSIVAVVEQAGLPRARIAVARYAAPAPQRPGKPKGLALRRRGGALTVRWKRSPGASSHRVQAKLSDGRRLLLTVRGRSLRIPAFGPRETAAISVRGVRGPYEGRAVSKRIRRARR